MSEYTESSTVLDEGDDNGLCFADPATFRGRRIWTAQMTLCPLIPSLALFIYSAACLSLEAVSVMEATTVSSSISSMMGRVYLVRMLDAERMAMTLLVAANETTSGDVSPDGYYAETDDAVEAISEWPPVSHSFPYETGDQLTDALSSHRIRVTPSSSYPRDEHHFYMGITSPFISSMMSDLKLLKTSGIWTEIVAFRFLLMSSSYYASEQSMIGVYLKNGQLTKWEFVTYAANRGLTRQVLADAAKIKLSDAVKIRSWLDTTQSMLAPLEKLIRANTVMGPNSLDTQMWMKNLDISAGRLYDIIDAKHAVLVDNITSTFEQHVRVVCWHIMVCVILVGVVSPFVFVTASRSTMNLYIFGNVMERKSMEMRKEKRKTERILHQMLPKAIAYRLKRGEVVEAESFKSATVFFSDIEEFSAISTSSSPIQVVLFLNDLYIFLDACLERYDVYKVETIGCVYMVASGLPSRNGMRHVSEIAHLSLDLLRETTNFKVPHMPDKGINLRIGASTGPVVGGVVGNKSPRYCLFGDTVNTASRMQTSGEARKVHITEAMATELSRVGGFAMEDRGVVDIKGKGKMRTFWLLGKFGMSENP